MQRFSDFTKFLSVKKNFVEWEKRKYSYIAFVWDVFIQKKCFFYRSLKILISFNVQSISMDLVAKSSQHKSIVIDCFESLESIECFFTQIVNLTHFTI